MSNSKSTGQAEGDNPVTIPIKPEEFYIRDLREYLNHKQISPEKLAGDLRLSHMTLRRWLMKKDSEKLPQKYTPLLSPVLSKNTMVEIPKFSIMGALANLSVSDLMTEIRNTGMDYDQDSETLEKDVKAKLKTARLDKIFFNYCKRLIQIIRLPKTPLRVKAVCIGALLYFICPIDLIPDHIPVIGYLDDLAVLSMALTYAMDATSRSSAADSEEI